MGVEEEQRHASSLKSFAAIVLVVEISVAVLYGVFVRFQKDKPAVDSNANRYPAYQDINVMMLIGFGFLMTFLKNHAWSSLAYTFFINSVILQLYILLSAFWKRVLDQGFQSHFYIYVQESSFSLASYSVASVLIAFGAVLGRVGPKELLIMGLVQIIGYTLNQEIVYKSLGALDVGGSTAIHTFGAYFGLTVSRFLSAKVRPSVKAESNYNSNTLAMVGSLFLWMYWPSFNCGVFATTEYTKSQIIINTILSLSGSCMATFMTSAFLKNKFTMEHLLNATLAGGVVIGASAGILYNPGAALAIGILTGVISTLCFHSLTHQMEEKLGIYDTCGVNNLHGIPGIIGGILSGVAAAAYSQPDIYDKAVTTGVNGMFPDLEKLVNHPYWQGGIQIAATFVSAGIGIIFGVIAGLILKKVSTLKAKEMYSDKYYFEDAIDESQNLYNEKLKEHTSAEIVLSTSINKF